MLLSLAQFAAVLAAPLLATRRVVALGTLGVQAICARVVHKLAGDAALGRYSEIAAGPGFARALSRVVADLRLAKLEPDTVRTVAPDLMPLFEAYETRTISIKIPAYRDMSPNLLIYSHFPSFRGEGTRS